MKSPSYRQPQATRFPPQALTISTFLHFSLAVSYACKSMMCIQICVQVCFVCALLLHNC